MKRTLRDRTISGLSWTAVSQVARQATNVVVSLILARLTGPSAFGLIGMVTIFTGFASLFVDLGLGSGLIQRTELKDEHVSAAFWINLFAGIILAGVMIACAPMISDFYREPRVSMIMKVSSLAFLIAALGTVQSALLSREMRFSQLAKIDITSTSLSGIIGVGAAIMGLGVWSLVVQTLAQSCFRSAGLWYFSKWRPRGAPNLSGIKDLAHFSGNLFVFNVINYWVRNVDNLLVGKYLGSQALGLYSRAYQLMLLPVQQIAGVTSNVLFPAMSSVQDDLIRLRSIYLRSIGAMHLLAAPIYGGLFAVADTFVFAVLGAQWLNVVPLLRILCIVGFFQPVGSSTGLIYTALGRADIMMKWGVITGLLYVASFFIGLKWGVLGITWSYCIAGLIAWYPGWVLAGRLIGLTFAQMLFPLLPSSLCAIAMSVLVWLIGDVLNPMVPAPVVLVAQLFVGLTFYSALVLVLRLKSGQDVLSLVMRSRPSVSRP